MKRHCVLYKTSHMKSNWKLSGLSSFFIWRTLVKKILELREYLDYLKSEPVKVQ